MGNSTVGTAALSETGEEITLSGAYRLDYYTFEIADGKYAIKSTTGHYFGMTKNGGLSRAAKPDCKEFTLTMNAETFELTIKYEITGENPKVGYLAFGTTAIGMSSDVKANLSLYKVAA